MMEETKEGNIEEEKEEGELEEGELEDDEVEAEEIIATEAVEVVEEDPPRNKVETEPRREESVRATSPSRKRRGPRRDSDREETAKTDRSIHDRLSMIGGRDRSKENRDRNGRKRKGVSKDTRERDNQRRKKLKGTADATADFDASMMQDSQLSAEEKTCEEMGFDAMLQEMYLRGKSPQPGTTYGDIPGQQPTDYDETYGSGVSDSEATPRRQRPARKTPRPPTKKEEAVCMNYLQGGNCAKGNQCPYSHNVQPRKLELCKFYMMDCCAKKEKCLYMHKDFPCKYYHTGMKCTAEEKGKRCKLGHDKLNDISRSVLLKHLELAPKEILGDFPRLSKEDALMVVTVTEEYRRGHPMDVESMPSILELEDRGFKYVDRAIRAVCKRLEKRQKEMENNLNDENLRKKERSPNHKGNDRRDEGSNKWEKKSPTSKHRGETSRRRGYKRSQEEGEKISPKQVSEREGDHSGPEGDVERRIQALRKSVEVPSHDSINLPPKQREFFQRMHRQSEVEERIVTEEGEACEGRGDITPTNEVNWYSSDEEDERRISPKKGLKSSEAKRQGRQPPSHTPPPGDQSQTPPPGNQGSDGIQDNPAFDLTNIKISSDLATVLNMLKSQNAATEAKKDNSTEVENKNIVDNSRPKNLSDFHDQQGSQIKPWESSNVGHVWDQPPWDQHSRDQQTRIRNDHPDFQRNAPFDSRQTERQGFNDWNQFGGNTGGGDARFSAGRGIMGMGGIRNALLPNPFDPRMMVNPMIDANFPLATNRGLDFDPRANQSGLNFDPRTNQSGLNLDPRANQGGLNFDPRANQGGLNFDPRGNQGALNFDPRANKGALNFDPRANQGALNFDPRGNQGALNFDPRANQSGLNLDPRSYQGLNFDPRANLNRNMSDVNQSEKMRWDPRQDKDIDSRENNDIGSRDPRQKSTDVDLRVLPGGSQVSGLEDIEKSCDTDMRMGEPSIYDVDLRQNNLSTFLAEPTIDDDNALPFKVPVHMAAKEIDASFTSHALMYYQLVKVTVPKPNFSHLKLNLQDPKLQEDPRIRRMMRRNSAEEPESPNPKQPSRYDLNEGPASPSGEDFKREANPFGDPVETRDPRTARNSRQDRVLDPRMKEFPSDPNTDFHTPDPRLNPRLDPRMASSAGDMPLNFPSDMVGNDPRMSAMLMKSAAMQHMGNLVPTGPLSAIADPLGRPGLLGPAPIGFPANMVPNMPGGMQMMLSQMSANPSFFAEDANEMPHIGQPFMPNPWGGMGLHQTNDPRLGNDMPNMSGGSYTPPPMS